MQTISIKSHSPEKTIPLLTNAIEREKRIVMDSLRMTRQRVEALAKEMGVDVSKLMLGEIDHDETHDMRLLELEGEMELLGHLESELRELETLEICR